MIKLKKNFLRGSYPPIITPFKSNGDLDVESLRRCVDFSIRNRVMCRYTAFLAVDASRRTAGDSGVAVSVPVPVPDGVRYDTTIRN